MKIKIYVANLRAYNAGYMVGEWFTLPVELDEIFQGVFSENELDEKGQPYGDWAIHDYEAPFKINEYDSIDKLNEIAYQLEDIKSLEVDENIIESVIEATETIEDAYNLLSGKYGFYMTVYDVNNVYEATEQYLEETGFFRLLESITENEDYTDSEFYRYFDIHSYYDSNLRYGYNFERFQYGKRNEKSGYVIWTLD